MMKLKGAPLGEKPSIRGNQFCVFQVDLVGCRVVHVHDDPWTMDVIADQKLTGNSLEIQKMGLRGADCFLLSTTRERERDRGRDRDSKNGEPRAIAVYKQNGLRIHHLSEAYARIDI